MPHTLRSRDARFLLPFVLIAMTGAAPQNSGLQQTRPADFQLVFLKPGTVIGQGPPKGWTDLILKSTSRLESGDLGTLPTSATATATLFKPVVLANVTQSNGGEGPRFRLTRVGMGLCVSHEGEDRVISSKDLGAAGESLGMIQRTVLSHAEVEQRKARVIARTPTFALLATPARLKVGETQKQVYLLYAMMVDPRTGKVRSVVWPLDAPEADRRATEAMVLLEPGLKFQAGLDVEAGKLLGAIPVSWEFAMRALPPGRRVSIPPELQALSANPREIAADPASFERKVRDALTKMGGETLGPMIRTTRSSH